MTSRLHSFTSMHDQCEPCPHDREIAHGLAGRAGVLADNEMLEAVGLALDPYRHVVRRQRTLPDRDSAPPSRCGHERSLDEDREGDDDEDDPVDPVGFADASQEHERREQDRYGSFQAAPGDEGSLAKTEPRPREQDGDHERPDEEGKEEREEEPVQPDAVLVEAPKLDRQPQGDEHRDLGEARQRALEALDLDLERCTGVAEEKSGDEDSEEAGAVQDGGRAVDDPGDDQRPERIEALAGQGHTAHERKQHARSCDSDGQADRHLDAELLDDDPERRVVGRRELDHADHQGDAHRVVDAGLPSRIVPERPPTSRLPSTENMTAGSVGASAAPMMPAIVQLKPKR